MQGLRLEVIKITPDDIPVSRLQELRQLLGKDHPRDDLRASELWVYHATSLFLRPQTSIHTWEGKHHDLQLILWQGDQIVAELYGMVYSDHAVVGGIHSDIQGGGTRLMRAFARHAGPLPVRLNSIETALSFYRHLGLRRLKAPHGHHPMIWPRPAQAKAAQQSVDEL